MTRDWLNWPEGQATRRAVRAAGLLVAVFMTACTAAPPAAPSGTLSPVPGTPVPATAAPATSAPATIAEATATAPAAAEPVNAWTLDGSGEAIIGGADLTFSGTFEPVQEAVSFDGATGFASTAGAGPVITTSSFSVAAWVSLGRRVDFAAAVSQLGDVAGAFYLGVGEGAWDFAMKTADTNEPGHTVRASSGPAEPDPAGWVHLVGVHDDAADQIRLYVDGQPASATAFAEPWQAEGPLTVGRSQAHRGPSDFWPGAIADVQLFSVALDDQQVQTQYADDRPTMPPPPLPAGPSACPSSHGGLCLGPLEAGSYTTRAFKTPLTYTVPDGWANFEDLPGNFLLIPPSGSNEGVDAGTSDYIGVYDGVAPISGDCEERPEPSVARTPEAMGAWYASHPGLAVEGPEPVTIGGLDGVVLDLAVADGDTGLCDIPGLGMFVPILIGVGPASLTHVLNESFTMRLYLLTAPTGEVIAIEIDDVPGGDTIDSMTEVVDQMEFGTAPAAGSAQRLTARPAAETSAPLGYYEYLPPGYGDGDPRPLLVFVHGKDECGDGSHGQLDRLPATGIPAIIQNNDWPDDRPFVVLAPQHDCPSQDEQYEQCGQGQHYGSCMLELQHRLGHPEAGSLCMTPTEIYAFISYAVPAYDVDPQRVYLTGLSCGAYSAFEYAAEHGGTQIAAMVPIAGEGRPAWEASRCELGQVAIWAFHGDADYEIDPDGTTEPIDNVMNCPQPPRQEAQLTVYPGVEHDSWTRTYSLSAGHDIYEWLLRFTLR